MIQLKANGIELHPYVTEYDITSKPAVDGSFDSADGERVTILKGYDTVITVKMQRVPHEAARQIAEVMQSGKFTLTYTTPVETTGNFRCTSYKAKPVNSDPRQKNPLITENITYEISVVMESADYGNYGSSGCL